MRIINVIGTRPNFMKIAPIIKEINKFNEIEHILVHTGQHYDIQLSDIFFEELNIPAPDISLGIGSDTHARQVAKIMIEFETVCDNFSPDAILIVGDVNSTMACALVAAKKGIKIFHVEAGIRSFDRNMPEEINRLVTDSITDYLLPPSQDAVINLLKEGHLDENIRLVGNVMIDTLYLFQDKIKSSIILDNLDLTQHEYVTLTLHRPSNVDDYNNFISIIKALKEIQKKIKIVYPIHPRTRNRIKEFELQKDFDAMNNLILVDSLGYFDFGKLVSNSRFVLTDSGGIQEETTVYGIPCITIRENTERPITVTEGTNELAGTDSQKIIEFSNQILNNKWKKGSIPHIWDGKASKRIVEFLIEKLNLETHK